MTSACRLRGLQEELHRIAVEVLMPRAAAGLSDRRQQLLQKRAPSAEKPIQKMARAALAVCSATGPQASEHAAEAVEGHQVEYLLLCLVDFLVVDLLRQEGQDSLLALGGPLLILVGCWLLSRLPALAAKSLSQCGYSNLMGCLLEQLLACVHQGSHGQRHRP